MLRRSLEKLGAGRSIVVDAQNRTIGGAHVLEVAAELGLPATEIETDGTELIIVKRTDLDYDADGRARELSIADNRTAEVGIQFDYDKLMDTAKELDISDWFSDVELERITKDMEKFTGDNILPLDELEDDEKVKVMKLTLSHSTYSQFESILQRNGATDEERILHVIEKLELGVN